MKGFKICVFISFVATCTVVLLVMSNEWGFKMASDWILVRNISNSERHELQQEVFESNYTLPNFSYIHNVPNACSGKKVELLTGIITSMENFDARQAIRESWGTYTSNPSSGGVLLFFIGAGTNETVQRMIDAEALKHGDMIQETFLDTYWNLTFKSVALVKWVSNYCSKSSFVMKADDDMYVNIPNLLHMLHNVYNYRDKKFVIGAIHAKIEPIRDTTNKYYVSKEEYPYKYFPDYVSGTTYAMPTAVAVQLYAACVHIKPFVFEDVFLTGMAAQKAGVHVLNDGGFTGHKIPPNGCLFTKRITGHRNTPDEIRKIHRELYDPNLKCR